MDKKYKVIGAVEFKSGQSTGKNGQPFTWHIYKATLDGYNGEVTGFDAVNPGDEVVLYNTTSEKNGKTYTNVNYKKPEGVADGGGAQATHSSASDRRILKLLVLMAQQIGMEKEAIMEVLES